jgi:SET domain-containing protein
MTYRPLPKELTIAQSKIDGLGLFAKTPIRQGIVLGISHVRNERFENGYIRTPLGGFINHSDNPNLETLIIDQDRYMKTKKPIKAGEELTLNYTLYNI